MFVFIGCGTAVAFSSVRQSRFANDSADTTGSANDLTYQFTNQKDTILINSSFGIATAFAFGMGIMVMAYCLGHISGGQFNPAVTLSLFLSGNLSFIQGIANICVQIVGSILAAGLLYGVTPNANDSSLGANAVAVGYSNTGAFLGETVMTAILCFVVHMTVLDPTNNVNPMAPLAIGFAVFVGHTVLIPVDGCSINPARSLGPAIVSGNWTGFWVFVAGPFLGSVFGVLAWLLVSKNWDLENAFVAKATGTAAASENGEDSPKVKSLNV